MAPELFPSVPGAMSGINRKDAEDRVTEKVSTPAACLHPCSLLVYATPVAAAQTRCSTGQALARLTSSSMGTMCAGFAASTSKALLLAEFLYD